MSVRVDDTDLAGDPEEAARAAAPGNAFEVHLSVFEGPFDLLLALISKHKLDITEVSLSQVTDEFIAYIKQRSGGWDLDQVSYFLLVAATLLDLKAARLLPSGEVEDEEDRAPLEARFAGLLPELLFAIGPTEFAALAARALTPKAPPVVSTDHIHQAFVSIREQAVLMAGRLRALGKASFRQLSAGAAGNYEIVASFLALLELYREDVGSFEQGGPLGELYVSWTGGDREVLLAAPGSRGGEAVTATDTDPESEEDYI